jgi:hypothetical protein
MDGKGLGEQGFGHVRRGQHEGTVTTVFAMTVRPWDTTRGECFLQGPVKSVTNGDLMDASTALVAESLDVYGENRPMYRVQHLATPLDYRYSVTLPPPHCKIRLVRHRPACS